jgi:MFS family permease
MNSGLPRSILMTDPKPITIKASAAEHVGAHVLTGVQWLVCAVAGLGFAFDLYESLMNALIVGPVLSSLGGMNPGSAGFNLWVGLFFFVPALAGGLFGLLGGYFTDLFGRRRLLVWSILIYSFSACAAGFANSLVLLLILRCTTLIGISVEAVAAIAWLAELFPMPSQRESALGYTQACYPVGGLLVSGAYYLCVT